MARIRRRAMPPKIVIEPKYSADAIIPNTRMKSMLETTEIVVAVGASTGG